MGGRGCLSSSASPPPNSSAFFLSFILLLLLLLFLVIISRQATVFYVSKYVRRLYGPPFLRSIFSKATIRSTIAIVQCVLSKCVQSSFGSACPGNNVHMLWSALSSLYCRGLKTRHANDNIKPVYLVTKQRHFEIQTRQNKDKVEHIHTINVIFTLFCVFFGGGGVFFSPYI